MVEPAARTYSPTIYMVSAGYGSSSAGGASAIYPNPNLTWIYHGNYDYVNQSVIWDPGIADHDIPASLFLSGKPNWFYGLAFPAFDPTNVGTPSVAQIPAGYRYLNGDDPPADSSSGPVYKRLGRYLRLSGLSYGFTLAFIMSLTGCQLTSNPDPIILVDGPKATELGKAKDDQIKGLVQQVKDEQEARELERKQASLVSANLSGILFAAEHVDAGLPRNAIEEEAKLGLARGPAPDPQEVIKAKDRVIAILQNEVDKAKALYGAAFNEAAQAKAQIAEKDKALAEAAAAILARDARIVALGKEATDERAQHVADVANALKAKDEALAQYKRDQSDKERRWLINATRIAALGLIVAGAVGLAVFRLLAAGGGLVAAGVLVGLISIGIETLTSQPWWPYLCAGVFIVILVLIALGIYHLWVRHQLDIKKTQAIQDMKDEGVAKGDTSASDELEANLKYRMGDKTSFWGKRQVAEVAKLGLINPKGEIANAAQQTTAPAIPMPPTPPPADQP